MPTFASWHNQLLSGKPSIMMVSPKANLLIFFIFFAELLLPLLIWKGVVPAPVRWLPDLLVVVVTGILFLRMFVFDQFPLGFWLIIGLFILSTAQATLQGQPIATTLWGGWRTLQLPFFAVYAYLNPHWPARFPQRLRQVCVYILAFELLIQIIQYATGEPIGDNLAGSFGYFGVSPLLMFCVITLSFTLGYGAVSGDWRLFLLTFALGLASSVLAENKIFAVATLLMAFFAAVLYLILGGKIWKLMPYGGLLLLGLVLFFVGYNLFVPAAERRPLQQFLFDEETAETYNESIRPGSAVNDTNSDYRIGRTFAMEYAWNFILTHTDPTVLFFGLGLGAKSESRSLGLVGIAFEQDGLGYTTGTGMMNLLEEMGLMGVAVMGAFMALLSYHLFKDMNRYKNSGATELRIALLIFTLLWPLWLWYKPVLWFRVTMILYWVSIGYVFYQRRFDQLMEQKDLSQA